MAIRFAHTIEVPQGPAKVFGVLDDFSQTPKWLSRCTGIEQVTPGNKTAGTKLRYSYRDGGRSGTMDGEVVSRTPDQQLTMQYGDKMIVVVVDFQLAPNGAGTKLTHAIEMSPKSFVMKLFAPMIRKQVAKQTVTAMESLRSLLASR